MPDLRKLQRAFLEALASGRPGPLARHVRSGAVPAAERIEAYARNADSNWRGALEGAYPVILRLVGPAFFAEAARRFARSHPSTSGDLHRFGARFGDFLGDYSHARKLEYLPDVARLEWACHESGLAPDASPFDFAALAGVPERRYAALRFRLHPAVRLLRSRHPVVAIHAANQPGRDGTPDRVEGDDWVLVRRPAFEVIVESLEPPAWRMLRALSRGRPLGEAVGVPGPEAAAKVGPALRQFVAGGVIAGFATSRTTRQAAPSRRQTRR